MTIKDFNIKIMRDETLRRILPLEAKRTYPYLTLEDSLLCASFIGFRVRPEEGKLRVSAPSYFLKIVCPKSRNAPPELSDFLADGQGKIAEPGLRLLAYNDLKAAESQEHIMEPKSRDKLIKLDSLFSEAMKRFDEGNEGLEVVVDAYDGLLKTVLEPEQLNVIGSFLNMK